VSPHEIIAAIRREHLKANIAKFEVDPQAVIHWDRAWVDSGGTIFGPGPYLKVPVSHPGWGETVHRVYPTARLRRRFTARRSEGTAP
jgi:hypothetical protein